VEGATLSPPLLCAHLLYIVRTIMSRGFLKIIEKTLYDRVLKCGQLCTCHDKNLRQKLLTEASDRDIIRFIRWETSVSC